MTYFGTKFAKVRTFKETRHDPTTTKFSKNKEVNDIVQKAVDGIILQVYEKQNETLVVKNETHYHENIDNEIDEKELYHLDKLIIDEK